MKKSSKTLQIALTFIPFSRLDMNKLHERETVLSTNNGVNQILFTIIMTSICKIHIPVNLSIDY